MEKKILRSSSTTNVNSLAKAILSNIKENNEIAIEAVGASAVNQAVKAVAVAGGMIAASRKRLTMVASFMTTPENHTAIVLDLMLLQY